jgi:ribosome biogenesis GTPase
MNGSLRDYGWDDYFAQAFERIEAGGLCPARVTRSAANLFQVRGEAWSGQAVLAGKLRHDAATPADLPTVGDWVGIRPPEAGDARIEVLLPRRSALSRKVSGKRAQEQVVAANVDLVVAVMGLDGDFSLRRLERYLAAINESGAQPLVLLNKIDLCEDPEGRLAEVRSVALTAPVLLANCEQGQGVEAVRASISAGKTAVLVGSSGAGKSTLINRLLGSSVQLTQEVREDDDRGRHTTSHRELFRLPDGGLMIDSPGIRELTVWGGERSLSQAFDDVEELASGCRFRDCGHESEQGCAVLAAVRSGDLEPQRLENYRRLQKEQRYLETRQSQTAQAVEKGRWREIQLEYRRFIKKRGR